MANSDRLKKNRDGKILIPMNVEGGGGDQNFITAPKVAALVIMIICAVLALTFLYNAKASLLGYIDTILIMLFIYQFVIRYIIFEEKYYYKVYRQMQLHKNPTPGIFWNIVSVRDTDNGAIITYSNLRMAVIVRLERDTIIGKSDKFKELHFDALSEFYKELNMRGLKHIQINIMEQAGKDKRIDTLDNIIGTAPNRNVASLLEIQLGYIKNITRESLYESDYYLIYSDGNITSETLMNDVIDSLYKLMDGAYTGFDILNSKEVRDMPKDLYDVKYFDSAEATLNVFQHIGLPIDKAFDISEIEFNSGDSVKVDKKGNLLIKSLASYIDNGAVKDGDWTIKEALDGKFNINFGSDYDIEKQSKEETGMRDRHIELNDTEEDTIIDLDNNAFGGEFGVGINSIKDIHENKNE